MTDFQSSNTGTYKAAPLYFHKLYVDSSHSSLSAPKSSSEPWEALNQYMPLFSGSYGLRERDPLEDLVSHRSAVLKAQVEGLTQQLYERHKIHEKTIGAIDYDVVKVDSALMQLDDLLRSCKLSVPMHLSRKQDSLEHEAMNLERQRRDEYAGFWKDQVLLRKELIELAGVHAAARARENILDGVDTYGI